MMRFEHPDQLYDMVVAQHNERLRQALAVQPYLAERPIRRAIWPTWVKRIGLLMLAYGRSLYARSAATKQGMERALLRTNAK
jgi:hypothetical protein